jgi:alpha-N-arabinofuranosidase
MVTKPTCKAFLDTSIAVLVAAGAFVGFSSRARAQEASAARAQITAKVDTGQVGSPVSKYIYGGFIEHGGTLMYRSLWAELIDDRKFYNAISSKDTEPPSNAPAPPFRMGLRKWRPLGPDEVVSLDPDHPFVGDHSPRIALDAATPHGIRQSGLTLVKDKHYTGRIYLRGTPGTKVTVSLIWSSDAKDRQTISFAALTNEYRKLPLSFTAAADTADGSIEITGTGKGNFHIGTLSLMPSDNVQGFRLDTIALLRDLRPGMWRLPGGNFISGWDWYNSIGDIDKRPPVFDHAWNAVQPNDIGMDELMTVCKLIGVDPYITVNAGFGDAHSAAEEVEYLNGPVTTHMGSLRAKNGHPEPYHVKYWNIGNEPYGSWQLGHTDLKYYVIKHNDFARAMRKADPSITLLASGAFPDEMTVEGQPRTMGIADPQVHFGSPADWTGGLLANCMGYFDGITEHWYSRVGKRFDYEHAKSLPMDPNINIESGYVNVDETLLEWIRHPSNRVHKKAEEWAEYENRFPAMADKKIFLSIDEYGYGRGSLKASLAYGMVLDEMLRHTDFLKMAAYTMAVSTLDFTSTGATYNSRGVLYKLYRDHFGTLPVALTGKLPQPAPKYPPYGDQPETSAGSPTYPLDMVAALTEDRKFLSIAVVNGTESEQEFDLSVTGVRVSGPSALWKMTGSSLTAENHVGQPAQVEVKEIALGDAPKSITVAPISVNIYRFAIVQ